MPAAILPRRATSFWGQQEQINRPNNKNLTNYQGKTIERGKEKRKKYSKGFEFSDIDSNRVREGKGGRRGGESHIIAYYLLSVIFERMNPNYGSGKISKLVRKKNYRL